MPNQSVDFNSDIKFKKKVCADKKIQPSLTFSIQRIYVEDGEDPRQMQSVIQKL